MNRFARRHPDVLSEPEPYFREHEFVSTRFLSRQTQIGGVNGYRYVEAIAWQPPNQQHHTTKTF